MDELTRSASTAWCSTRGWACSVPEDFSELLQLVVRHLGADGLQPFGHEALPERLADDVVRDQAQDAVQPLLQLGHRAARLVPVAPHLQTREVSRPSSLTVTQRAVSPLLSCQVTASEVLRCGFDSSHSQSFTSHQVPSDPLVSPPLPQAHSPHRPPTLVPTLSHLADALIQSDLQ